MAERTRRRRSSQAPSPTSMIVNFFLDHPMEIVEAALELAQTIVARRRAKPLTVPGVVVGVVPPVVAAPPPIAPPPALAAEAAPAPLPAPAKPRQRARRSDAGQPRKRGVQAVAPVTGPVAAPALVEAASETAPLETAIPPTRRRGRPPINATPVTTAPELPPQDVPFEARDVD